ncbi:MAG: bifunctional phosphopantothenoylcysteine decarboxylase/phosphopantothenate--cysteine ligase CoaBC [Bulleidia sp.]|nr:bifunctional phosphopantothenoylcysteine decarboxylase/phosphopantothenate--cysteine ligase CoaBC [Erysipelotrichaceae bacterium 7770_A6]MEE0557839.1 bifunctional phosphopantothenoylcysteine decarboxylase/phosphopantothenate--cysteine ligase CoaBC [Bulleidia sp.]
MNENKCIIVGITGGIAVYKICYLVSSLKKQGYDVHVLMSKEAQEFVTPLTFQTLSNNKVITDMFTIDYTPDVHHISLAKKADLFVIAPATANVIAKVANGIADDMLTTTFLASNCEKLIVPAMNTQMLMNPVTQDNIQKCKNYGMHIFESNSGYLACGDVGKGRLPEPDEIEDKIKEVFEEDKFLEGKHILVTAGPTSEAIDPVRMITNHSTGKMGYALARAARNMGAHVTLVSGTKQIEDIRDVEMVHVTSAKDMAEAVLSRQNDMDCMILAAAVADYTPVSVADNKIHKSEGEMSIPLKRTQDILKTLGENKKDGQVLIGFSMETENMVERTKEKLVKKNCDYIVANNLKEKGAGFGTDTNIVTLISKDYEKEFGILSKYDTAVKILKTCLKEKKA